MLFFCFLAEMCFLYGPPGIPARHIWALVPSPDEAHFTSMRLSLQRQFVRPVLHQIHKSERRKQSSNASEAAPAQVRAAPPLLDEVS